MKRKVICKKYLKSWFAIDIIASFPLYMIVDVLVFYDETVDGWRSAEMMRMVKLSKVINLIRMVRVLKLERLINRI